jgi:hypothetical protein
MTHHSLPSLSDASNRLNGRQKEKGEIALLALISQAYEHKQGV